MPKHNLFSFHSLTGCTKLSLYDFIARSSKNQYLTADEVIEALLKREESGKIQISEELMLPHFEHPALIESKILIIALSENGQDLFGTRLAVAVLLREKEDENIKRQIVQFMRFIADDAFYLKLLEIQNETEFNQLLKQKEEGS